MLVYHLLFFAFPNDVNIFWTKEDTKPMMSDTGLKLRKNSFLSHSLRSQEKNSSSTMNLESDSEVAESPLCPDEDDGEGAPHFIDKNVESTYYSGSIMSTS